MIFFPLSGIEPFHGLTAPMQSAARTSFSPDKLRAANISPVTYLATDFLNHYNEVAMLIDMLGMDVELAEDVLAWHPMTYIDHFRHSGFRDRDLAIEAYSAADPSLIVAFETRCQSLDEKILDIQKLVQSGNTDQVIHMGKPLYDDISDINGLIVGSQEDSDPAETWSDDHGVSQSDIDDLFA